MVYYKISKQQQVKKNDPNKSHFTTPSKKIGKKGEKTYL